MLVMLRLNVYTRKSQKNKFLYSGIEKGIPLSSFRRVLRNMKCFVEGNLGFPSEQENILSKIK